MSGAFAVVPLTEAHLPRAAELERLCFSLPWPEEALRRALTDPAQYWLAAVADGRLMGYAGMQTVLDEGYIDNVAVDPAFRRRGAASALLRGLVDEARRRELAFLTLEVRESNTGAIALYEKFGFKPVGRRRYYYEKPKEDAILMTLIFGEGIKP